MQTLICMILLGLNSITLFGQVVARESPPLLSVCELLIHRNEFNGKMVSVRGAIEGTNEGAWLRSSQSCKYKLVTRGITWPNVISLEYPNNESPNPEDHANFDVDWNAINTVGVAIPNGFNRKTDQIVKTYVGLFQTYPDLDRRLSSDKGDALKSGFGHLGGAPARILVKTVKDAAAVHRPPDIK
jgi:hypothetical protein